MALHRQSQSYVFTTVCCHLEITPAVIPFFVITALPTTLYNALLSYTDLQPKAMIMNMLKIRLVVHAGSEGSADCAHAVLIRKV